MSGMGVSSGSPRWSVVIGVSPGPTSSAALPAPMAGLPGKRAIVSVGPPLLASEPRSGSATPSEVELLFRPPEPPVPTRSVRAGDRHAGVRGDDVARAGTAARTWWSRSPATIVLLSVSVSVPAT